MIDIRLLEEKDKDNILNLMNSREFMQNSSNIKIPDYSLWLNTKEPYTLTSGIRQYGLFEDGVLTHYRVATIWNELPDDLKSYSCNLFSLKRTNYLKDSFGHDVNTIKLINYVTNDMELLGYTNSYAITSSHPALTGTKPHCANPECTLNKYQITEMETIDAGEVPNNNLFKKYLIGRPYDIPLYIRNFYK
jgi:hypothetical protein